MNYIYRIRTSIQNCVSIYCRKAKPKRENVKIPERSRYFHTADNLPQIQTQLLKLWRLYSLPEVQIIICLAWAVLILNSLENKSARLRQISCSLYILNIFGVALVIMWYQSSQMLILTGKPYYGSWYHWYISYKKAGFTGCMLLFYTGYWS